MQYWQATWAIFRKFFVVDGFLSPCSEAKFQHYGYRNVGLSSSRSQKFRIFRKKIAPKGSPWPTFTQLGAGDGVCIHSQEKYTSLSFNNCIILSEQIHFLCQFRDVYADFKAVGSKHNKWS